MKIALIIDIWTPVIGGSQKHVWEIASRLTQTHNCRVDIFTRALIDDDGKKHRELEKHFRKKLRVVRVAPTTKLSSTWGRVATLFSIAWKIRKEDLEQNYDFIHAHSILGGFIGKLASYLTKKPLLFTVHGSPNLDGGKRNFDYYAEKFILTKLRYDKVISVGKSYLFHKNINNDIELIPNGVDIEKFDAVSPVEKASSFKIIFVGRLDWVKGIDTLIEAVKILKEKQTPTSSEKKIQVHIVGYGFCAEKYKTLVKDSGVDNIVLFKGRITGKALIKEYKSSRLFILPSLCEGQPLTILEAMAAGLPVLTTFAADNTEVVRNETGWKVRSGNAVELAGKIEEIMCLPEEKLNEMGQKAYQIVAPDYRWEKVVDRLYREYSKLKHKSPD